MANGRSAAWVIGGAGLVIAGRTSGAVSAGSQLSNPIESNGFPFSTSGSAWALRSRRSARWCDCFNPPGRKAPRARRSESRGDDPRAGGTNLRIAPLARRPSRDATEFCASGTRAIPWVCTSSPASSATTRCGECSNQICSTMPGTCSPYRRTALTTERSSP